MIAHNIKKETKRFYDHVTYIVMSTDNMPPTLLEHQSTEILLQIFAFLPFRELIKAFFGLNSYINSVIQLVRSASYEIDSNNVDAINLLQLFPSQTGRLIVANVEMVDFTSLNNLRSLTLKYGTHAQFNIIRPQYFPILEILRIKGNGS
jgi:hypothetical protein